MDKKNAHGWIVEFLQSEYPRSFEIGFSFSVKINLPHVHCPYDVGSGEQVPFLLSLGTVLNRLFPGFQNRIGQQGNQDLVVTGQRKALPSDSLHP